MTTVKNFKNPEEYCAIIVFLRMWRSWFRMILSQISYLDCIVFVIFLAPQLLIHVGLWQTARWVLGALPFLGMLKWSDHKLPWV